MVLGAGSFFSFPLSAQEGGAPASKIKAVFLFNFTRFIDWPPEAFTSPDDPFVIAIIGNNPFGTYIEESVAGEKVGMHPIVVNRYEDEKDVKECHILYINLQDEDRVRRILKSVEGRGILTVGERPSFTRLGGMVRFYTDNNKIRFEINTEAAKAAQITISSKLLSVAKTY